MAYTARAVTNSYGMLRTYADSAVDTLATSNKPKENVNWGKPDLITLGTLLRRDDWSLLASFIRRDQPDISLGELCTVYKYNKQKRIDIDNFIYYQRNTAISRKMRKGNGTHN